VPVEPEDKLEALRLAAALVAAFDQEDDGAVDVIMREANPDHVIGGLVGYAWLTATVGAEIAGITVDEFIRRIGLRVAGD
jgi:hypothetical protein